MIEDDLVTDQDGRLFSVRWRDFTVIVVIGGSVLVWYHQWLPVIFGAFIHILFTTWKNKVSQRNHRDTWGDPHSYKNKL